LLAAGLVSGSLAACLDGQGGGSATGSSATTAQATSAGVMPVAAPSSNVASAVPASADRAKPTLDNPLGFPNAPIQTGPGARTVYTSDEGTPVASDFSCIHHTGLEVCWPCLGGQDIYFGPDPAFDARINSVRLYGMGGLEWGNSTEKAPGQFDWSYWDSAFAKFRRVGVKSVTYTLFNPPPFYTRQAHDYGGWRMQLPNSQAALNNWLNAITTRYPEIRNIEVANEVFAPGINSGFWIGTEQELMQLADWVLDWRKSNGWNGSIWSPSIPGFLDNVAPIVRWLKAYPRTNEFDAIPAHFYFATGDNVGDASGPSNSWTGLVELRAQLKAAGINKPLIDGEKGFGPGQATPASIFNYGVRAALEGLQQVCFFHWGSKGGDETNVGQPYQNPEVKAAFEELANLAGKRITKVEQPASGGKWIVTTQ